MNRRVELVRTIVTLLVSGILAGCSGGAQTVGVPQLASSGGTAQHVPDEVLVRFHPGADTAAALSAVGAVVTSRIPRIDVWVLRLSGGRSVADAIKVLQARSDVRYAEPNYVASVPENSGPTAQPSGALPVLKPGPGPLFTPNAPAYPAKLWGLVKIGAATAWNTTKGESGNVVVAILDTGVDATHPDLSGKVLIGANCLTGTCVPGGSTVDVVRHGTHVSGTAAAKDGGVVGLAFDLATKILPVKVLGDTGSGTFAGVAAGIVWATDTINAMGKKGVLNMSLGGFGYSQAAQNAVQYATRFPSILVVVAMGNSFKRFATLYPAALPGVMAVGATDGNDNKTDFSDPGAHISVSAPGRDVYSTVPGAPSYAYFSGTSMATPHVVGVAALVWSANPTFTNYQVRRAIEESAVNLGGPGWNETFGWGRINAAAAVTRVPAPFYGCAGIHVQSFPGPAAEANADVILTGAGIRRTAKTDSSGDVFMDFLAQGSYTATASKVIGGVGNFGSASVVVTATMNPTACASATIGIGP